MFFCKKILESSRRISATTQKGCKKASTHKNILRKKSLDRSLTILLRSVQEDIWRQQSLFSRERNKNLGPNEYVMLKTSEHFLGSFFPLNPIWLFIRLLGHKTQFISLQQFRGINSQLKLGSTFSGSPVYLNPKFENTKLHRSNIFTFVLYDVVHVQKSPCNLIHLEDIQLLSYLFRCTEKTAVIQF